MVADWPVTSLAPQIECPRLGRHRQIALKLLMDPRLNSRCPPRLRPLPSLALNVLLLGDTNIAMASSTATTKTSSKRTGAAANGAATPTPGSPEAIAANDRDFFWTYTEEPHRTRRLAIIKAHPEACCRWIPSSPGNHHLTMSLPGHQALRSRTPDQVRRRRRRRPPSLHCPLSPRHPLLVVEVLGSRLCLWRDCKPEPLPRHP